MTNRERLLTVMKKEMPDKVPMSFFVQEEFLSWFYPDRKIISRVDEAVDCAKHFDLDIITRENQFTRPYWLKKSSNNWELNEETRVEGDIYYRRTSIMTPEKVLTQVETAPYNPRILTGIHFHTQEYFIKEPEDFEVFRKFFPAEDPDHIRMRHEAAHAANARIGDQGISCPWGVGGVYNMVSSCRNIQELLMDPYVNPEFYIELMSFFTDWIVTDYEKMVETEYDALGIQGNIANGSLFGSEFFAEHIMPYEKKITSLLKQAEVPSIYHNCGYAKSLYPSYKELGIDVWETVAPDPMGDNTLKEAKEYFGRDLILSGNLDQVNFLKQATTSQVAEEVEHIIEIGKPGGCFIFAASDYLEPDTPEENIKAAVSAAREFGKY